MDGLCLSSQLLFVKNLSSAIIWLSFFVKFVGQNMVITTIMISMMLHIHSTKNSIIKNVMFVMKWSKLNIPSIGESSVMNI